MAQKVNLDQFSAQELNQLKQGFEAELNTLSQSMNQFRFAMDKYDEGKRSIKAAEDCKDNEEMLIPLSNSLYI
jgi:prefoldin subunit 5